MMARIGSKNTAPELAVRRAAHAAGFRFRLHRRDLPGTPDLVFPRFRAAIFVHGCFWHGHGCTKGRLPKSRADYWYPKIEANRARDAAKSASLDAAGWRVLTIWQCETADPAGLSALIRTFLKCELSDRHSRNDQIS
ncbi:MAG: very short patch repair endonuclease [Rubrimonas sp.]